MLWKSHTTRNQRAEGSHTPPSPPSTARDAHTERNWRHSRTHTLSDSKHSENTGSYKAPKVPRIQDIEEIVRKRIKEASQHFREEAKLLRVENFWLSALRGNHISPLPEGVRHAKLRVLLESDRPDPTPLSILGQDGGPLSWWLTPKSYVSIQSQGCCLWLALYTPETISPEIWWVKAGLLPAVRFPMWAKEEQQPSPHHQDEAWGESQIIRRLFPEPNGSGV